MKKCPTCQKTFDDNLRFCQSDGTPLVEDAPPPDPYATMVASKDEIMSAMPDEPKDDSPASAAEDEDDLLDIPDESDSMKTMFVTDEERKDMFDEPSSKPIPPPTFGQDDLLEDQPSSTADTLLAQPEPPKFSEPSLNPPSFGDSSSRRRQILRPRRQARRLIMNRRHLTNSRFRAILTRRQNRMKFH